MALYNCLILMYFLKNMLSSRIGDQLLTIYTINDTILTLSIRYILLESGEWTCSSEETAIALRLR